MSDEPLFWEQKTLGEMSAAEWESLCDGCAKCCLAKLEDEDTGRISFTNVACRLLNLASCRCSNYANRQRLVPDCVALTAADVADLHWLPSTCAYRLLAANRPLPWWHPLVSGDPDLVHRIGVSVVGKVVPEAEAGPPEHHIVQWPA